MIHHACLMKICANAGCKQLSFGWVIKLHITQNYLLSLFGAMKCICKVSSTLNSSNIFCVFFAVMQLQMNFHFFQFF